MKTVIHVNQQVIVRNRKTGATDPPITVKTYKSNQYASSVVLVDDHGREVARVVYRPDAPLSCGARLWIEADDRHVRVEATDESS